MSKSITKNYLYNLSYQLLTIITPLLTTPYVSRVLGVNNIGIYEYTLSIANYFILFGCVGLNLYGQREIAFHQQDKMYRSKIFWELIILRFIMVSISIIIYLASVVTFSAYSFYYLILLINIMASVFDISWLFQGIENFKVTATRNFIIKLAGIILIFTLVKTKEDLYLYFLCNALPLILGNMSLWLQVPRIISKPIIDIRASFKHLRPTLMLFIPQVAVSVYTLLDKSMLGFLVDDISEVGYYGQSEKIIKIVLTIVTSLGSVMLSRTAAHFAEGDEAAIKTHINLSLNFVFFMAFPLMFGLIGISQNFVPWFFGNGFDKVGPLMCIISPIILLIGLSNVIGMQYLLPTMRQKEYGISVISGAAINFLLNLMLITKFKSFGASAATVCAELGVTLIQLYFVRKKIDILSNMKSASKYFLSGIVMLVVVLILGNILNSFIAVTVLQIIVGMGVYFGLLILLRDKFFLKVIVRVLRRMPDHIQR